MLRPALALSILALLVTPAAGQAATAGLSFFGFIYDGEFNEFNVVDADEHGGKIRFSDGGANIVPSTDCVAVTASPVDCDLDDRGFILARLGNGDDRFDASTLSA